MSDFDTVRAKTEHPHAWIWEPLESNDTFALRAMFGARSIYLDGKIIACFCTRDDDPWKGMLICTVRECHESLITKFPALVPHPVITKWLYLSESSGGFERTAPAIIRLAAGQDPRIGVIPPPRKKSKRKTPI